MTKNQKIPFHDGCIPPSMGGYQPINVEKKGYQPPKSDGQKPTGTPPNKP